MADERGGKELPQRFRGDARAATSPSGASGSPVLSAELRQRLEAVVTAERSAAAARAQDRPASVETTIPPVRRANSLGGVRPPGPRTGGAEATVKQEPPRPANAGPVTEDEVTEWLGTAGQPPGAMAEPGTGPAGEDEGEAEAAGWLGAGIAALIVIPALVIGSLAVVAVRHFTGTHPGAPSSAALASQEAVARQQAAVRGQAAAWIARQVSPGATVSCDQAMCAALEARGRPAGNLLVLGPISPDPRHTDVVVETAAVRSLFGTSLDLAWAPGVLASFGSGSAGITVRVVAPHGAVAYQTALTGDLAARKAAGGKLLADRRVSVSATARAQLIAGLVDMRVLQALTALSRHQQVSLVGFGNVSRGASPGMPLRYADLSATGQVTAGERAYLDGLESGLRPARTVPMVLPDGQAVLRVEFTAPSPLRLSGG